uniref:Putative helicase n=1 Tax=viral metagenome TaxID=1070528 RepID=A0A6H1ZZ50_9ZZZZ
MGLFDLRKDLKEIKQSIGKQFDGVTSGIKSLDDFILGFGKGEMSTIAGRPGMGKSSMSRDILLNIGKPTANKGACLLCTLEMSCEEVTELLAANLAKVDYNNIKKGHAGDKVLDKFHIALEQLSQFSVIINDDSFVTPDSIRDILKSIEKDEPITCLIVDYLQLMSLRKKVTNRQEEVSEISRELKTIAREFNIPVIAFSQLNRNVEYRESSRPRMVDLRESGSMENDSTKIILIHRPSYYDKQLDPNAEDSGEAELIICKNRSGAVGTVDCAFISNYMSFCDIPEEYKSDF